MNRSGQVSELLRSLRFRLATAGFLMAYAPTLAILAIGSAVSGDVISEVDDSVTADGTLVSTVETSGVPLSVVVLVAVCFAPFAGLFAWWWSGRAVAPISEAVTLQERLIEETSHELRTPLAILTNNAQVLLQHPEPSVEVYRQGLERSETVARRMTDTINTLLVDTRGRARTIGREPTDLSALVAAVADRLTGLAMGRDVTVEVIPADSIEAAVDRESVDRAVSNLVTNAIQHAPAGTAVSVGITAGDGMATISVTDSGPGVPPADQSHIFERYWRAGSETDGAGIGLSIVRQVAVAHGGTATVTSPVKTAPVEAEPPVKTAPVETEPPVEIELSGEGGPGSCFALTLPLGI